MCCGICDVIGLLNFRFEIWKFRPVRCTRTPARKVPRFDLNHVEDQGAASFANRTAGLDKKNDLMARIDFLVAGCLTPAF